METKRQIATTEETTPSSPRWVPKPPPPPSRWERLRFALRRSVFPIAVLIFLGALVYFMLWLPGYGGGSFLGGNGESADAPEWETLTPGGLTGDQGGGAPPGEIIPLTVTSEPAGATVLIDGDAVGTTPLQGVDVERGAYILSLQLEGYRMPDTLVVLRSGAPSSFSFRMRSLVPVEEEPVAAVEEEPQAQANAEPEQPVEEQASPPPQSPIVEADGELEDELPDAEDLPAGDFAMGNIVVSSEPAGAAVLLNGIRRGTTPTTLNDLQIGPKEVTIQLDGHESYTQEVDVQAENVHTVFATLSPLMGSVRVLARPWGSIYINGELHEAETNVRYTTELPVGTHIIRVDHPTLGSQEREVTVREGEVTSIVIDLNE